LTAVAPCPQVQVGAHFSKKIAPVQNRTSSEALLPVLC
jgi:hypothetical protein